MKEVVILPSIPLRVSQSTLVKSTRRKSIWEAPENSNPFPVDYLHSDGIYENIQIYYHVYQFEINA